MPSTTIDPRREARRLIADYDRDTLELLACDPVDTVRELLSIPITFRPASRTGGSCGVDGSYDPGPPARIFVAEDTIASRQAFTVLHELGHHLVENDDTLNEIGLTAEAQRVEEVANAVAAAILLNDDLVDTHLSRSPPTPEQIAALFEASEASRSACCVAAAQRLTRPGCVMLATDTGVARFTAHHIATNFRVARNSTQDDTSIVRRASANSGRSVSGMSHVNFASGHPSGELHARAYGCEDGWVFAVFIEDTIDPWAPPTALHIPTPAQYGETYECINCDATFWSAQAPCSTCGSPVHEGRNACGRCNCRPGGKGRACQGTCGLLKPEHQFPDGGDICVDCI